MSQPTLRFTSPFRGWRLAPNRVIRLLSSVLVPRLVHLSIPLFIPNKTSAFPFSAFANRRQLPPQAHFRCKHKHNSESRTSHLRFSRSRRDILGANCNSYGETGFWPKCVLTQTALLEVDVDLVRKRPKTSGFGECHLDPRSIPELAIFMTTKRPDYVWTF